MFLWKKHILDLVTMISSKILTSSERKKTGESINFMYDNYDVFRLLLVCSKGTPYESFQERLVEIEMQGIIDLFGVLEKRGFLIKQ